MASDIFLKIEGVDGESTDDKFKNHIEVLSYSWGASNPPSPFSQGAGLGAGKVSFSDINISTSYSKASPKLMMDCALGEHLKKATLIHRKAGGQGQVFLTYHFSECLVSSYQSGAQGQDSIPMESFSLAYTKVELEYLGQAVDGKVAQPIKVGYNLQINKKV